MKKILLILLIIATLTSCDIEDGGKAIYTRVTILKKSAIHTNYTGVSYTIYTFNGTHSKWYYTNLQTYNMYKVGDTINALLLTN